MTRLLMGLTLAACTSSEPAQPTQFDVSLENISGAGILVTSTGVDADVLFAPGILVHHHDGFALFEDGQPALHAGFEAMVEDGANAELVTTLTSAEGVVEVASFAALDASYNDAPMMPGDQARLSIFAVPGDRLTVATMFGQSNDVFAAVFDLELFDEQGEPIDYSGSDRLTLWDAGTEVNEEPGLGPNQAPRQEQPDTGEDENGVVEQINGTDADGFAYPSVDQMLNLEVRPGG